MNKWGFLRENTKNAIKAGIDKETGLHRTGLEEYLKVIFPDINDWIHDMPLGKIDGVNNKIRPDYRSYRTEFDETVIYTNQANLDDIKKVFG